ncbi:glycine-rich protein [Wolffia australiana]
MAEVAADGPVMTMMSKRLRALRKKYNRILQMEESLAQGKTLNKEQEEVFRSKPAIAALIDEYEKLRQPLSAALQEELELAATRLPLSSSPPSLPCSAHEDRREEAEDEPPPSDPDTHREGESAVEDLINLLYFGCLFDVKSQSEFASMVFTRTHERESCLTYDYVTDDSTGFLLEKDLDLVSNLAGLVISRPVNSGDSHRNALRGCFQRAKLWLSNADQPILPDSSITYADLRERLNRILSSEYFTKAPELKAPADVAVAVGKFQAQVSSISAPVSSSPVSDTPPTSYQEKEESPEVFDPEYDQSGPVGDSLKKETDSVYSNPAEEQYQNQRDVESSREPGQQGPRRPYQNQTHRGGGRGRGRRDFVNGRGPRGGGYFNGRSQFYDPSYYQRSYYSPRGRGGRGGSQGIYGHAGAADGEM